MRSAIFAMPSAPSSPKARRRSSSTSPASTTSTAPASENSSAATPPSATPVENSSSSISPKKSRTSSTLPSSTPSSISKTTNSPPFDPSTTSSPNSQWRVWSGHSCPLLLTLILFPILLLISKQPQIPANRPCYFAAFPAPTDSLYHQQGTTWAPRKSLGWRKRSSWTAVSITPRNRRPPENSSGRPTTISTDGLAPSANGITRSPRC